MSRKSYLTKLINDNDSDAVVYCIGLVSVLLVTAVYFIIRMSHIIPETGCAFRRITGLYCPGCGGTRSFVYLIHGHIIKSLAYHPFVPYVFTIAIIFYVSQTVRFISKGRTWAMHLGMPLIIPGAAIILLNWIVRNIFLVAGMSSFLKKLAICRFI